MILGAALLSFPNNNRICLFMHYRAKGLGGGTQNMEKDPLVIDPRKITDLALDLGL